MNCPYCEAEMEQGFVQSSRGFIWSKSKRKLFFLAGDDDIDLTSSSNFLTGSRAVAYLCRRCKKITIDYSTNG